MVAVFIKVVAGKMAQGHSSYQYITLDMHDIKQHQRDAWHATAAV